MRFTLEARLGELESKQDDLVKALVDEFRPVAPGIADALEKALPTKPVRLRTKVLRDLQAKTSDSYREMTRKMLSEIYRVLDGTVTKAEAPEPGEEPDDPDYDAESGEPIIDPKSGLSPSEQAAEKDSGEGADDEEEDAEKSLIKALAGPYIGPRGGKWADAAHKIPWDSARSSISKLKSWTSSVGGKVRPHKSDPGAVVVKVPPVAAAKLLALKQELGIEASITKGSNYVMLAVPVTGAVEKLTTQKKQKPVQKKVEPKFQVPTYATALDWSKKDTVEEYTDWCKGLGITANFPDVQTAEAVTKALSESHPMVIQHVQFVGTGSQLNKWAKANPEMAAAAKTEAKHPLDLAKHSPLGGGAVAVAHPITAKPYTASVIVVQDSYWNAEKAGITKSQSGGFTVSSGLGDTVRHELGHVEGFVMRHLYPVEGGLSMWETWKNHVVPQLKKKQVSKDISHYAQTNPHEAWAELAVLRRQGHAMPQWVDTALKAMKIDDQSWESLKK